MAAPRILVVEDNVKISDVVSFLLKKAGFEVAVAYEWKKAFEELEKGPVHVVVLDIMLPGIDGYEILRSIRKNPKYQKLPVIVCSALGSTEDDQRAMEAGATDVMPKPYPPKQLIEKLRKLTGFGAEKTGSE